MATTERGRVTGLSLQSSSTFSYNAQLPELDRWVDAYLNGESAPLPPLAWPKLPPFTRQVLNKLLEIPFGATTSYGELCGLPHARAVGNACNANPFPLLIPCHRVLAKDGLGGFAFGPSVKQALLAFES